MGDYIKQWHRKLFKTGGYLSYQDVFLRRKIKFLWSDSENWRGLQPP